MDLKKIGLFAGGVWFGTAGIKALSSKDAKKAYTDHSGCIESKGQRDEYGNRCAGECR